MDGEASSSPLKRAGDRARHTLTIDQVAEQLLEAGVPRSKTRIAYFCREGTLDAGQLPSPTGDQWYINPASIPGLIGDLKQFDEQKRSRAEQAAARSNSPHPPHNGNPAAAGRSPLQQGATANDAQPKPLNTNPGAASFSALERGETDKEGTEKSEPGPTDQAYVSQLEKRIEEKDETIKFLQDELIDRRNQISGMKLIIDGQRELLQTINNNVAPVFGALAQLVSGKAKAEVEPTRTTIIDQPNEGATT